MADQRRMDPADVLGRIGQHWGWLLLFGILTLLAGVAALVWPRETLVILAIVFGAQLIVSGIFELVEALSPVYAESGSRWLSVVLGGLSIVVGILCLRNVTATLLGLALLLGLYWIVHGLISVFHSIADRRRPNRGWTIFTGVLSVIAGIIVLAAPALSLLFLAMVLGIWLIVYGATMIWSSIRLRGAARSGARAVPGSPSPT